MSEEVSLSTGKSKVTLLEDKVIKTYIEEKLAKSADPILTAKSNPYQPSFYFKVESYFLEIIDNLVKQGKLPSPWKSPQFFCSDKRKLEIGMERIRSQTYKDNAIKALSEGRDVITEMNGLASFIADFHLEMEPHQDYILKNVKSIKFRNFPEERNRTQHYLRVIIYSVSKEFRENYSQPHWKNRSEANKALDSYLKPNGVNLNEFANEFIRRDWQILYDISNKDIVADLQFSSRLVNKLINEKKIRVIHGDLGPQHIFKDEKIRIIDFDEMRLGAPEVDLISAVYNMYVDLGKDETELRLMEASLGYLKKIKPEPTEKDKANFLARMVESRLKEFIRLFATECKYSPNQLTLFIQGHPDYKNLQGEELKRKLLEKTFINGFQHFLSFYQRGGGWEGGLAKSDYAGLLNQQFSTVESILRSTNVFKDLGDPETIRRMERLMRGTE